MNRTFHTCALLLLTVACSHERATGDHSSALEAEVILDEEAAVVDGVFEPASEEAEVVWFERPVVDPDSDEDGDGFAAALDADDRDPFTHPGAREEPCDGVDQDGDGVDPCSDDFDGDGVVAGPDCDDRDPAISPRAVEVPCNGLDENCNGTDECFEARDDGEHDRAPDAQGP